MTKRLPVSVEFPNWHDAQRVSEADLEVEQNYTIQTTAALINNHFGSGVLPSSVTQKILFDSNNLNQVQAALVVAGDFDGTGIQAHAQPGDLSLGNQIEVELINSTAYGRNSVKVLVVGVDFENNPQYDRFTFYRNEKQVTKKHYTRILGIFFNDFLGNNNCSQILGGQVVIREAASFQLSRDPVMIAQDVEPNLFFRDFKVANNALTLYQTIQIGIGSEFAVDALNITTTPKLTRTLQPGDVTTKIGQKFIARTNNIQKVTLLLGANPNYTASIEDRYDWTGTILVSVWALQTTVNSPTDIIPELQIEFSPSNQPIAQLSYSRAELENIGYILTDALQPVDFVFSDTVLGNTVNSVVIPGRYYAVTINRTGAANTGTILTAVGNNSTTNSREVIYGGGTWNDNPEEDIWFQVWTDAAKVADGQAYDGGQGVEIDKTTINNAGVQVDYALDSVSLAQSGQNVLNIALVEAVQVPFDQEQDERTGQPVYARQEFQPQISFVTSSELTELKKTTEPIVIGGVQDINPKKNPTLTKVNTYPGVAQQNIYTVINPDPDLLSLNLVGSRFVPDTSCMGYGYLIGKVRVCSDGYGDVDGNGIIDISDIVRATQLIGESLSSPSTQVKINDGYIKTTEILRANVSGSGTVSVTDVQLITQYVAREINSFPVGSSFTHMELTLENLTGRMDGYYSCDFADGYVYLSKQKTPASELSFYELIYDGYTFFPDLHKDTLFTTTPFAGNTYQIIPIPFWQDYMLVVNSQARSVPASFTFDEPVPENDCAGSTPELCRDTIDVKPATETGRNDIMFPDNLIINRGEILRPDGTHYKVDFEVGQIILELPEIEFNEVSINMFEKFVYDAGDGKTNAGYNCMRFADCSPVTRAALELNQVQFNVSIQALSSSTDGYDVSLSMYTVVVDGQMGVYVDNSTGILTLNMRDLVVDQIYRTKITKILITVYLKKGGFNNVPLIIPPEQIEGLLAL